MSETTYLPSSVLYSEYERLLKQSQQDRELMERIKQDIENQRTNGMAWIMRLFYQNRLLNRILKQIKQHELKRLEGKCKT